MPRIVILIVCAGLASGSLACAGDAVEVVPTADSPVGDALSYVNSPEARRAALERSVAVAETPYGQLRLDHYSLSGAGITDSEDDWDLLDVFEPTIRPLRVPDQLVDVEGGAVAELPDLAEDQGDELLSDWVSAGEQAFQNYPIVIDPTLRKLRESAEVVQSYGLSVDPDGTVNGAVEIQFSDGRWGVALTCAACHSFTTEEGRRILGLSNRNFRIDELLGAYFWSPGTMDVTGDGIENPVQPADLRAIRWQERLHHSGNLANGRIERMVRIETLMSSHQAYWVRPNRVLVASIALFLESLGEQLPRPDLDGRGGEVFSAACAECHEGDGLSGPPIGVSRIQTDSAAAEGSRGTGGYRAPSLLGLADRGLLLHDGSALSLPGLLGLEPSDHVGHPFGTNLPEADREALVDLLLIH